MPTLLLRLVAPMQSWGVGSRFTVRDTAREPTKSGVIGLVAAAMGRPREHPVDDLARLRMGVRVDLPGRMEMDYHTAQQVYRADPKKQAQETVVSRRYYLVDAAFLVGLQGDDRDLLEEIHRSLRDPCWPLFLGRRAFAPAEPIWLADGLRETSLLAALESYPWLGRDEETYRRITHLRVLLDDPVGSLVRNDLPISFDTHRRRYAPRTVSVRLIPKPPSRLRPPMEEET